MLLRADARAIPVADGVLQCVVTSPPYWGLRDYGLPPSVWGGKKRFAHEWGFVIDPGKHSNWETLDKYRTDGGGGKRKAAEVNQGQFCRCGAWRGNLGLEPSPELYVQHIVQIFREVRRVLRPDGTLWLNLGDSYAAGACRGKGPQVGKQATNHGTDWFAGRPQTTPAGLKPKDLVGIPWLVAFALQADGWYLRSDVIWSKPNPMPESVRDRPTKAHEYIFLLSKSERYFFNQDAVREPFGTTDEHRESATTWVRGWASGPGSHAAVDHAVPRSHNGSKFTNSKTAKENTGPREDHPSGRNVRTVWEIATQSYKGSHFATFPEKLAERCILAGSRAGDLVLDPFGGTGTVGRVAERLCRRWVCLDLKYHELSAARTTRVQRELLESAGEGGGAFAGVTGER